MEAHYRSPFFWDAKVFEQIPMTVVEVEVFSDGFSHVYRVEPESWESRKYTFDPKTEKISSEVVGKFTQYPIRPAWAITIHKSQGQTLERIVVDLGSGAFAHGQVYVALSRCPTLAGITLATEIWPNDVLKVSSRVREFMETVSKAALLPGSEGRILGGGGAGESPTCGGSARA